MDVLSRNMGATDEDIEQYYSTNKETFKTIVKPAADTAKKDTVKVTVKKDSVSYKPMIQVKDQIIKTLFLSKYCS